MTIAVTMSKIIPRRTWEGEGVEDSKAASEKHLVGVGCRRIPPGPRTQPTPLAPEFTCMVNRPVNISGLEIFED